MVVAMNNSMLIIVLRRACQNVYETTRQKSATAKDKLQILVMLKTDLRSDDYLVIDFHSLVLFMLIVKISAYYFLHRCAAKLTECKIVN